MLYYTNYVAANFWKYIYKLYLLVYLIMLYNFQPIILSHYTKHLMQCVISQKAKGMSNFLLRNEVLRELREPSTIHSDFIFPLNISSISLSKSL